MPYGYGFWAGCATTSKPTIGRPKRDRAKVKAGRKAARRR